MAIEAHKALRHHASEINRQQGMDQTGRPLALFHWNDAKEVMMAGACGLVCGGWFTLELLWVEAPYRRQGIGTSLLQAIEYEAMQLGAHSAYMWTQDFEAPEFYHRHGYQEFVRLQDFMPGHQLIGMQKRLLPSQ